MEFHPWAYKIGRKKTTSKKLGHHTYLTEIEDLDVIKWCLWIYWSIQYKQSYIMHQDNIPLDTEY